MPYYLPTTAGVLVILVRHGHTELNNPGRPIVRGWKDAALTSEGEANVARTAMELAQFKPQWIVSSDFMRDSGTAQIIANKLGIADFSVDFDSRTWDVGAFSGKPEDEVADAINDLYRRTWQAPPGSDETFDQFSARWLNFLDRKMEQAQIDGMRPGVIVTHGRNIALSDSHFNHKMPEDGMMPYPAGYALVSVAPDRSVQCDIQGETECVCVDI